MLQKLYHYCTDMIASLPARREMLCTEDSHESAMAAGIPTKRCVSFFVLCIAVLSASRKGCQWFSAVGASGAENMSVRFGNAITFRVNHTSKSTIRVCL
jgi:hypothetical protein